MQDEYVGEILGDYKVISCEGKLNPKRRTKYYKYKCQICGEIRIAPKKYPYQMPFEYSHNKKTCINHFRKKEIGNTYEDYKVIEFTGVKSNKKRYDVQCKVCNRIKNVCIDHLKNNKGTSHQSCVKNKNVDYSQRFYNIWSDLRKRTTNSKNIYYENYGGRGISSEDYKFFIDFYDDMHESYLEHIKKYGEKDTTIERIDVNGDYSKNNLTWATNQEQNLNKRDTKKVKIIDKNKNEYIYNNVVELSEDKNLIQNTIYNCLNGYQKTYKGYKIEYVE